MTVELVSIRGSQADRAFNCPGSVQLEQQVPPQAKSDDAREGDAAHWCAAKVLSGQFTLDELVDRQANNGVIITGDMIDHVNSYIDFVRSWNLPLYVEQEFPETTFYDSTEPVFKLSGHVDVFAYDTSTKHLMIADLKYGWRVVEAQRNFQLLCYYLLVSKWLGDNNLNIHRVSLTIVQPRPNHRMGQVRSWELAADDWNDMWEKIISSSREMRSPECRAITGTHCNYCTALPWCVAAQRAGMNAVDTAHKAELEQLDDTALALELKNLRRAKAVLNSRIDAIEALGKDRIKQGSIVPGWSLDKTYGNRSWVKGLDAGSLEALTGVPLTESKLITPAAAERAGANKDLVASLTERSASGYKLVEVDLSQQAKELFNAH